MNRRGFIGRLFAAAAGAAVAKNVEATTLEVQPPVEVAEEPKGRVYAGKYYHDVSCSTLDEEFPTVTLTASVSQKHLNT